MMSARSKPFNVKNIDFAREGDMMALFVKVAKTYPKQADSLFKKYVSYLCKQYPTETKSKIQQFVVKDIEDKAEHQESNTRDLMMIVYDDIIRRNSLSVKDVSFDEHNYDDMQLMSLFINIAKHRPGQGKKLFDKYVDWLCKKNPGKSRDEMWDSAASNIGYMTGYFSDKDTVKLLFSVYRMIYHPLYGRYR